MIYIDNIISFLQKAGGISTYWFELVRRIPPAEKNVFNTSRKNIIFIEYKESSNNELFGIDIKILRYFPFLKRIPEKSIFHSSYYRFSLQKNIANVTTVHDFTYEYFRTGLTKWIHHYQKAFAIYKADGIICVSENTKKDLLKFVPNTKNIKVIYNGVGDEFKPLNAKDNFLQGDLAKLQEKKYLLYIGDRSAYKNFNVLPQILLNCHDLQVIFIGGGKLKKNEEKILNPIKERVIHLTGISSEILNIIYNNAFCLFYPSSYEGFGIPILEAMKAGCPVVSTNFSSIPEVAGDAALLVDRIEADAFLEKLEMLEDPEFRSQLIEKGFKQAAKFSWDKCFEETYAFYEEVYKRKFG